MEALPTSLLSDAMNQMHELIMIVSIEGNIVYGNDSVERVTGYSPEEYLGQNCQIFRSGAHDEAFYRNLWRVILAGETFSACFVNQRKDGSHFYEEESISPIKDRDGEVSHLVSVGRVVASVIGEFTPHQNFAHHDQMTGLPNRFYFSQRLSEALVKASRRRARLAVFCIDLDHFKNINDTLGHSIGDEVIKTIANRIDRFVRADDTCARLGGDEFVLLIEDVQDIPSLGVISQNLIEKISEPILAEGNKLHVACSIGISLYPKDGTDGEALMNCADQAMYRAKNFSMGRFVFFREEKSGDDRRQGRLEQDIHLAVSNRQFKLYYQPQIDLKTGECAGVEALLRWEHPELGLITPDEIVPLLEATGLAREVGEWTVRTALKQIRTWDEENGLSIDVGINLSGHQLIQRDFVDKFENLIGERDKKYRHQLNIEITEDMLLGDMVLAMEKLHSLDKLGIQI